MALICRVVLIGLIIVLSPILPLAADMSYDEFDLIREGGFEGEVYSWFMNYYANVRQSGAKDGKFGLRLKSIPHGEYTDEKGERLKDSWVYQLLTVPTQLDAATLRFDYRVQTEHDTEGLVSDIPIRLEVFIGATNGWGTEADETPRSLKNSPPLTVIGHLTTMEIDAVQVWRDFSATLEPSLIDAMQKAHSEGQFLFLVFAQRPARQTGYFDACLVTDIDNISMLVKGTQHVPQMQGEIAYSTKKIDSFFTWMETLKVMNPNTRETETIWTHPKGGGTFGGEIGWSPDNSQLAFTATWEITSSVLDADIITIGRDGSGLRKLTAPTPVDLENNNYPRITINGTLQNETKYRQLISVKVEGVKEPVQIQVDDYAEETFTIHDVPVLGDPKKFNQVVTLKYSSHGCFTGASYFVPDAAVLGDQISITIPFFGEGCNNEVIPGDLTWKHDGSVIYFSMLGFHSIPVDVQNTTFAWDYIKPDGNLMGDNLAWSPVDDRYLFTGPYKGWVNHPLYIAEQGGEPRLLVENNQDDTRQAWLPDGSGFIYLGKPCPSLCYDNIYYYDMTSGKSQLLTYFAREWIKSMSISPDGRYIVFTLRSDIKGTMRSDLWIMDRLNPVEMWPITDTGVCYSPSWSGADLPDLSGVKLEVTITGQGTVTRDPDRVRYDPGTQVTLTATPAEGWRFDRWTGNVADETAAVTTITLNNAEAVTATFIEGNGQNPDREDKKDDGGGGGGGGCFISTTYGVH